MLRQREGVVAARDLLCLQYSCARANRVQCSKKPLWEGTLSETSQWRSVPSPSTECHSTRCCTKRYNYPCLRKLTTFNSRDRYRIGILDTPSQLHITYFTGLYITRCMRDRFSFATFDHEFIAALIPAKLFSLNTHF